MSLSSNARFSIVAGLILGLIGLLAGPVVAIAQGVGGWYLLRRWETLRQRWSMIAGWTPLTAAVTLVFLAVLLDVTFVVLLGRLVQQAMP